MMTRRQALKTTALVTAVAAATPAALTQTKEVTASASAATQVVSGSFTLPPLPYAVDALEPHIDARTMEIHHDRHHKAYVDNLNKAVAGWTDYLQKKYAPYLEGLEALLKDLDSVPENIRTAVRNQGGGHYNHSLFWQMMKKNGGGEPKSELAVAIDKSFGNLTDFKTKFTEAATKVFGSGWAWLVFMPFDKTLGITARPNQDSPISDKQDGKTIVPILALDVWEHAYYLKYQNKRADYIAAWWKVVNWDFVAERYAKLAK